MWTSTMDLDLKKVLFTQIVGRFYRNIFFSSYSPLQVQNLPRQSLPDSNWVRVRNRLAGICGSDLHLLYGDGDLRIAPAAIAGYKHSYPGHEVVGEVIEIGDDVQHLRVGDRVVLQSGPNCISADVYPICRACAAGNFNVCEHGRFIAPQPMGGGWSEEMLLHEQQLYRVPPTLSDEQAVMLEPTAVALHAVLRRLPRAGERVLIIGAGTIGLLTLKVLRALVPDVEISVMARYPFQVEQATRSGAAHIIYPQDAYAGVQRVTQAQVHTGVLGNQMLSGGYDVIFDTIGQRKTLHHALRWTRAQGTVVLVGIHMHLMNIDLSPIWYEEINLIGSTSHGMEQWPLKQEQRTSTYDVVTDLIEQGRIVPEQLITHHFALDNYKNALLTATNKDDSRAIKVVFDYSLLQASVVPNVRASAARKRRSTVEFSPGYLENLHLEEDIERQRAQAAINKVPPVTPLISEQHSKRITPRLPLPVEEEEADDTAVAIPTVQRKTMSVPLSRAPEKRKSDELAKTPFTEQHTGIDMTPLPVSMPEPLVAREPQLVTAEPQELTAQEQVEEEEEKTQLVSLAQIYEESALATSEEKVEQLKDIPETPLPVASAEMLSTLEEVKSKPETQQETAPPVAEMQSIETPTPVEEQVATEVQPEVQPVDTSAPIEEQEVSEVQPSEALVPVEEQQVEETAAVEEPATTRVQQRSPSRNKKKGGRR